MAAPELTDEQPWAGYGLRIGGDVSTGPSSALPLAETNGLAYWIHGNAGIAAVEETLRSATSTCQPSATDLSVTVQPSQFTSSMEWDNNDSGDQVVSGPYRTIVTHAFDTIGAQPFQRDLLFAGDGADFLIGAEDGDLLLTGLTSFANLNASTDLAALSAIRSE